MTQTGSGERHDRDDPRPPGVTEASPLARYVAPWASIEPNTLPVLGLTMWSRPQAKQVSPS
jgi:hypothetical protein